MMMIKRETVFPNRLYVDPPLYGNYPMQGQSQSQSSYGLMKDKLQKLTRADKGCPKSPYDDRPEKPKPPNPWRSHVPKGTNVCFEYGKGLPPTPPRGFLDTIKRKLQQKRGRPLHLNQLGKKVEPSDGTYKKKYAPPKPPPPPPCSYSTYRMGKKQYYNVMWDPHVARGATYVRFEDAQREKCRQHELDLNRCMQFRNRNRRRERLDRCNPLKRICTPDVKLVKEPLCYAQFAQFLTETVNVESKEEGTSMQGEVVDPVDPKKRPCYSIGLPAEVQTDPKECREDTIEWITTNMKEKIREQALLEATEESDMEVIRGQRTRFEMVLLYKRWQLKKQMEWYAWLTEWYHIRSQDILAENAELQTLDDRLGLLGFSKNAVSCVFCRTNHTMKMDGFIDKKSGRSFEEQEELDKYFTFEEDAANRYGKRQLLARKVLDSQIVRGVVHRFDHHMHDQFGRPHGLWLTRRKPRKTDAELFDAELEKYLEKSYTRRHGIKGSVVSIEDDFDPESRLFDKKRSHMDITTEAIQLGQEEERKEVRQSQRVTMDFGKVISKTRLGRKTQGGTRNAVNIMSYDDDDDDDDVMSGGMDVLFKRKTSWSTLEKQQEKLAGKRDE